MDCNASLVLFIFFYIIAFIYVKEPHYKLIGYVMLSVIYFLSLVSIGMNREIFILPTLPTMYYYAFLASIFCVVFVTAYSLITVIDAYFAKANKVQTFDLKLSQRFKNHLLVFENTFIVGWTSFALFLLSLTNAEWTNKNIYAVPLLASFVCVWIQLAFATKFAKIKRDL